jgi:putative FmdB family regulatory protein
MPTYDYKCASCEIIATVNHSILESPKIPCEKCSADMTRIPSVGAVAFRGGGWGHSASN